MSAFDAVCREKKDDLHFVTILYEVSYSEATSATTTQLDLHYSYHFSALTWCCTTLPLPLLCFFLSFLSLLLMWDQSVFVHAGWQLSAMFTTAEGEASLSQSRWGGLVRPLSLLHALPTLYLNILEGLGLWNNKKLIGLPKVYGFVEVTLCLS